QFEGELAAIIIGTVEPDLATCASAEGLIEGVAQRRAGDALADIAGEQIAHAGIVDGFDERDGGGEILLGGGTGAGAVNDPLMAIEIAARAGHDAFELAAGAAAEFDAREFVPAAAVGIDEALADTAIFVVLRPQAVQ